MKPKPKPCPIPEEINKGGLKMKMSISEFENRERELFNQINNPKTSYAEECRLWKQIEELYDSFYSPDLAEELVGI